MYCNPIDERTLQLAVGNDTFSPKNLPVSYGRLNSQTRGAPAFSIPRSLPPSADEKHDEGYRGKRFYLLFSFRINNIVRQRVDAKIIKKKNFFFFSPLVRAAAIDPRLCLKKRRTHSHIRFKTISLRVSTFQRKTRKDFRFN